MSTLTNTVTQQISIAERAYVFIIPAISYFVYFGDSDGKLYAFLESEEGDNARSIGAYWRSKRLDFTDQFPQYNNTWKTIDKVQLIYLDKITSTPVTIYISNDGGVTWTSRTRTLGTGNGKTKTADFFFMDKEVITGKYFNFKIECSSATKTFEWLGLEVTFIPRGEYFEVS